MKPHSPNLNTRKYYVKYKGVEYIIDKEAFGKFIEYDHKRFAFEGIVKSIGGTEVRQTITYIPKTKYYLSYTYKIK